MGVGHHRYRMCVQMECFGQSRDRFRLLNSAVGVEHKAVRWHLMHDASARPFVILRRNDLVRIAEAPEAASAESLPPLPAFVVPSRMGKTVAIWLSFGEDRAIDNQNIADLPEDADRRCRRT